VTMPSRDKPLPQDSADRAAKVGAASAVGRAPGSAVAGAVAADAALRVDGKELMRCGARSA
jgi:hypothetical protein